MNTVEVNMRYWHSLFTLLKYPITLVFIGMFMLGIGNIVANPYLGISSYIQSEWIIAIAEMASRIGQFLVVNFPVLFLIRITTRKGGNATSITSAIAGYIAFLVGTIFFANKTLPSNAFSSILGISVSSSTLPNLAQSTNLPLQTGIIGTFVVSFITLWAFNSSNKKSEYALFPMITKEISCFVRTVFFSLLAGIGIALIWPYFIAFIQRIIHFIERDTTNPINLGLYGVTERILSVLNLPALIRQPFWYSTSGGSWVSTIGTSVSGDASIWTAQLSANAFTGMNGRFVTPHYILNLGMVPGMVLGLYSLYSDKLEKKKRRSFVFFVIIVSLFTGSLLPLELMIFFLAPLLFIIHTLISGALYSLLQILGVYLGYATNGTSYISAMPGTILELINYFRYPSLQRSLAFVLGISVIMFFLYYFGTRLYFRYMAVDLFKTGIREEMIEKVIKAAGGIENIRMVNSSITDLTLALHDLNKFDALQIKRMGTYRITESKAGFHISIGSPSIMIARGIENEKRSLKREIKETN
ncbi:MAG: hypothetical protein IJ875_03335 [Solobacterium sp.]|nr:hypothetical protein [Solobacterium sp.]